MRPKFGASATLAENAAVARALKAEFPILGREGLVYLDTAASAQKPLGVLEAEADFYRRSYANVHRAIHTLGEEATRAYEEARTRMKNLIGAGGLTEVIFTRGTTESINLVARTLGETFRSGDEIVLSEMEHHANLVPRSPEVVGPAQRRTDGVAVGVPVRGDEDLVGSLPKGLQYVVNHAVNFVLLQPILRPQFQLIMSATNRTFTMIKPDAVANGHIGAILNHINTAGFRIVAMKLTRLSVAEASEFYGVHSERSFFGELVEYMTSGPIVAAILEKDNAVADFRTVIGATDPAKADEGTIRRLYAQSIAANAVHGSDSDVNATIEGAFFFSGREQF